MTQNRYPETTNPEQCILVIGNPVDGLRFVGRFDTPADASDYGDQAFGDQTWWVTPLECVQCDEEGNWVNPEIGDDPDDMPHGPKCAMRFCNAAECTCEKSELVHKLSSDEIIDMQKHTPVFITNGCCEATHDSLQECRRPGRQGPRLHQLQGRQGPRIRPSDPGPGSVRKGSAMNIIRQCYDDWGNFHEPLHSPWFMFVMLFIIDMGTVLLLTS